VFFSYSLLLAAMLCCSKPVCGVKVTHFDPKSATSQLGESTLTAAEENSLMKAHMMQLEDGCFAAPQETDKGCFAGPPETPEILLVVQKTDKIEIGLDVRINEDKSMLEVLRVNEGLVSAWNKVQETEMTKVIPGDRLTAVNGYFGSTDILFKELRRSSTLRILVLKTGGRRSACSRSLIEAHVRDVATREVARGLPDWLPEEEDAPADLPPL